MRIDEIYPLAILRNTHTMEVINLPFMLIRYVSVVSLVLLSSCSLSDLMLQPVDTGSTDIHTGTVATGMISTGSVDHQSPLVEDISGSGGAYYPIFDGLETRVIPVEHHS